MKYEIHVYNLRSNNCFMEYYGDELPEVGDVFNYKGKRYLVEATKTEGEIYKVYVKLCKLNLTPTEIQNN